MKHKQKFAVGVVGAHDARLEKSDEEFVPLRSAHRRRNLFEKMSVTATRHFSLKIGRLI